MHRGHASSRRNGASEVGIAWRVPFSFFNQLKCLDSLVLCSQLDNLRYRLLAHPAPTLGASVGNRSHAHCDCERECGRDGKTTPASATPNLGSGRHVERAQDTPEVGLEVEGRLISIRRITLQQLEDDAASIVWQFSGDRCSRQRHPLNGTDGVDDAPAGKGIGSRRHLAEQHTE